MKYYEFNEIVGKDYVYGEDNLLKRRNVRKEASNDWWSTSWGKILLDPNTQKIDKHEGKTFRRRFRVPTLYFLDYLVPKCKRLNVPCINMKSSDWATMMTTTYVINTKFVSYKIWITGATALF